ncbi:lipocalin family protein [Candidatus Bacteroides intestinigallinarum]|uniref:lipocalin family protein n=1 Tax=Candidatus Bacteroides intestinigallinarum TaxID=2838470 RepID=UPI0022E15366|nr:lipocalin family protein [Candidatus Bacteroides intestinigallinarum]
MKTFRFFATLLVIALCAGFTSCSDDDDENLLVGTWVNIEDGGSVQYKEVMTINADGTGSSTSSAIYADGYIPKEEVDNFKYTYDENSKVFTFIWEEDSDGNIDIYSMHIKELTNSKLVFIDDIDEEGEGEVITYTKQ